jgi:site-specific DNA-cytosine methylase
MLILELFSGTGSVSKVAKSLKYNVISVDINPKSKPDILTDILNLDYKRLRIPDFIWASPPCNTFSYMGLCQKVPKRDKDTYKAISPEAVLGDKLLKRTLTIIRYFKKLNPYLKWVIENPSAMMAKQPSVMKLQKSTTTYCHYGSNKYKPTDFFNNFSLKLKPKCTQLNRHVGNFKHARIAYMRLNERYAIPPLLIKDIFKQAFK